jgi:arginine exporter protein ArgO
MVLLALATLGATTAITQHRRRQTSTASAPTPPSLLRAYFALLGMTLLNPTTIIYFTALVLGSQDATTPTHLDQSVFVLAAFAASASWQLALATGGALLGRLLTTPTARLVTAVLSSLLITGLALHLLLTTL